MIHPAEIKHWVFVELNGGSIKSDVQIDSIDRKMGEPTFKRDWVFEKILGLQ